MDVPIADMGPSADSHIKAASLASGAAGHDGSDRSARSLKERPRSSSRRGWSLRLGRSPRCPFGGPRGGHDGEQGRPERDTPSRFAGPSLWEPAASAPNPSMSAIGVTTGAECVAERTPYPTFLPGLDRNGLVPVLVRGSKRTFELRERLRAVGMKWMPHTHAWSGVVPVEVFPQMEAEGLHPLAVVPEGHPLDRFREAFVEKVPELPSPRAPARKPRIRARKEAPVKASPQDRAAGFLQVHGWNVQDITANLADQDRADDEHRVERHLRDLRSRVKAVRAKVAADSTIRQTLATCPEKARAFYAINGVTEAQVKRGVPEVDVEGMEWDDLVTLLRDSNPFELASVDWTGEEAQRVAAVLPGSGMEVTAIP